MEMGITPITLCAKAYNVINKEFLVELIQLVFLLHRFLVLQMYYVGTDSVYIK
jgi:hypothetical protein